MRFLQKKKNPATVARKTRGMTTPIAAFAPVDSPVFVVGSVWSAAEDVAELVLVVDDGCAMIVWFQGMRRLFVA